MTSRAVIATACLTGSVIAALVGAYLRWGADIAAMVLAGALFAVAVLLGWDT